MQVDPNEVTIPTVRPKQRLIVVYFKDGRIFEYEVCDMNKAREHMSKIWELGYRTVREGVLEWFGPHYIDKMKYLGDDAQTSYPDIIRGT